MTMGRPKTDTIKLNKMSLGSKSANVSKILKSVELESEVQEMDARVPVVVHLKFLQGRVRAQESSTTTRMML